MKHSMLILIVVALCGCTTFKLEQTDQRGKENAVTTKLNGTAWFSSAQGLAKIKASQSEKTQSFGVDSINQQGTTNSVAALTALLQILQLVKPVP